MANNKKKKAHKPAPAAAPAGADERALDEAAQPKKEAESESKHKAADKKSTDKDKAVIKAKARAKDPKKPTKKPNIFRRLIEYLKQVRLEIKRTTWPTRSEVLNMTIIVIVALLFFGILIFIINTIVVELLKLFAQLAPDAAASSALDASVLSGGDASGVGTDASSVADTAADASAAASDIDTATDTDAAAGTQDTDAGETPSESGGEQ